MEIAVNESLNNLIKQYGTDPNAKKKLFEFVEKTLKEKITDVIKQEPIENSQSRKPVRVYLDGCFDIMHSGHYNAIRQAKALGDILVAGVHSDAEILKFKGPSTFSDEERTKTVSSCKWVDEVAFDVPYSPSIALLDKLNCDFCVHGDDMPTTPDGSSAYSEVMKADRIRVIKRTEGVSTTDLVGRLLLMTRTHHVPPPSENDSISSPSNERNDSVESLYQSHLKKISSHFLTTTQRLVQFANSSKIKEATKVVYIDGSFDLFHIGHIETLEEARKCGDFLLVGIHDDQTVNKVMGKNYPIMNLHERVFNVLACKYVDEVIIGAPWIITKDLITTMNIKLVVEGSLTSLRTHLKEDDDHPVRAAKELGIYEKLSVPRQMTAETILERIMKNRKSYEKRNQVRVEKEKQYLEKRQFLEEI